MWTRQAITFISGVGLSRCRSRRLLSMRNHSRGLCAGSSAAPGDSELLVKTDPDQAFLETLVCPFSKAPLTYDREARELISPVGVAYPVTANGIPNMIPASARMIPQEE